MKKELPVIDFTPLINLKLPGSPGLVGREWLWSRITAWLDDSSVPILLMLGDPGSPAFICFFRSVTDLFRAGVGKSAIAVELSQRKLKQLGFLPLAYHICSIDDVSTLSVGKFVQIISDMCRRLVSGYREQLSLQLDALLEPAACDKDPVTSFIEAVLKPLAAVCAKSKDVHVVVVDSLDESLQSAVLPLPLCLLCLKWCRRFPAD